MANDYGNNAMSALVGPEPVRKRPETVLGSKGLGGAQHTVVEMIGNALDEATAGYGTKVKVHWFGDGRISVRDYGRGIPLGWNPNAQNADGTQGDWQWHMVYERMYAGGKYGDDDNQAALRKVPDDVWAKLTYDNYMEYLNKLGVTYLFSIGLNGLGAYATCASARYLLVRSFRSGICSEMHFTEGVHDYDELKTYDTDEPDGTYVEWQPDDRVFTNVDITSAWVRSLVKGFSVSSSIDMVFIGADNKEELFPSATVLTSLQAKSDSVSYSQDFTKTTENGDIALMASQVAVTDGGVLTIYVNNVLSSGGAPADAFYEAVSDFMTSYAEASQRKFKLADYNGEIACSLSIKVNIKSLRGQTKDSIDNQYIFVGLHRIIGNILQDAYSNSEPWLMRALSNVDRRYNERIAYEEMASKSKDVTKALKQKVQPIKFMSSVSYRKGDAEHTELWLVEGDSAKGGIGRARDPKYQAIFPMRGKSKNIYKADALKTLTDSGKSSNKIAELLGILGCGTVLNNSFDINDLKVGKIIVLSDADKDGYHIRMLVFVLLLKYAPELIYGGHLYMCEAPLYKVILPDGSIRAAWTREELDKIRADNPGTDYKYYKGIGQMDAEDVAEWCLRPEHRIMNQVVLSETDVALNDTLEFLFGSSVSARKKQLLRGLMGDEDYDDSMKGISDAIEELDSMDFEDNLQEVEV